MSSKFRPSRFATTGGIARPRWPTLSSCHRFPARRAPARPRRGGSARLGGRRAGRHRAIRGPISVRTPHRVEAAEDRRRNLRGSSGRPEPPRKTGQPLSGRSEELQIGWSPRSSESRKALPRRRPGTGIPRITESPRTKMACRRASQRKRPHRLDDVLEGQGAEPRSCAANQERVACRFRVGSAAGPVQVTTPLYTGNFTLRRSGDAPTPRVNAIQAQCYSPYSVKIWQLRQRDAAASAPRERSGGRGSAERTRPPR